MKYKLSDFDLNKQSLKRKLSEIVDETLRESVENLLNRRTTIYDINDIEYIVDALYSNKVERNVSNKPLGVYYSEFNKEKYDKLKSFVEIKKTGSITFSLEKDVKKVIKNSNSEIVSEESYKKELESIAEKYGILITEVYKIVNQIENEWLNNIEI